MEARRRSVSEYGPKSHEERQARTLTLPFQVQDLLYNRFPSRSRLSSPRLFRRAAQRRARVTLKLL
ncbi:hypothetical protein E2C01_006972 [Portunus trituberculatus]|uniref:Uncharacterized protein n=1 Tax=Portunus trituberculatus TaxID=210409 RepID=A0A5B7CWV1_PORTR|nr:hypothetical protein [Portunus trituberculatus]